MKAFLDTSSLLKLYHYETGSEIVENFISKNVNEIFLSELTILEFRSAIWRKVRENKIDHNIAIKAVFCFENDYKKFRWIRLQSSIITRASNLLMKYGNKGLRTLDSLQLSSALSLKKKSCIFLTSDNLLKSLFYEEKLNVFEQ
ncbi:MAG: type II toxin-antitoxin system VapC family toxin [bacterium]